MAAVREEYSSAAMGNANSGQDVSSLVCLQFLMEFLSTTVVIEDSAGAGDRGSAGPPTGGVVASAARPGSGELTRVFAHMFTH